MKNLKDIFNQDIIDLRDVCESVIITANNYLNSAKTGTKEEKEIVAESIKNLELEKFKAEKKDFIDGMKHYANSKDLQKEFRDNCNQKLSEEERTDADLAKVLEWINSNFTSWEDFKKSADNEPTGVSEYYFNEYARDLAEDCYLPSMKERGSNPLFNFIDWEGWAEFVMQDYQELSNPFFDRCIYLRN